MSTLIPSSSRRELAAEEPELLERARGGDRAALEALVRPHLAAVYDLTLRILGDRDFAADATQDAFVNALGAIDRFRGEASLRTWLLRIAANAARSVGRRRQGRRETVLDAAKSVASAAPDPAHTAVTTTESERVAAALERLPPKQRTAVTLRTYQGLSFREIGEIAGCSEGAARVNYHLGLKRLRELLA